MALTVLALSSTLALAAEPLHCPSGTRLAFETSVKQIRTESCVLADSGVKQGPARELRPDGTLVATGTNNNGKPDGIARIYNEQEVLMGELTYDHGNVTGQHFTLTGLEGYANEMNERLRAEHKPYTVRAINEATLGVDFRFADASARTGGDRLADFQRHVLKSFCALFGGTRRQLQTIRIQVFNAREETPQTDYPMTRADCAAAPPRNR